MKKTYTVKILTPGQILIHRGKRARTPVTYKRVTEEELKFFQTQCRRLMLEYETIAEDGAKTYTVKDITIEKDDADIIVEKLEVSTEPKSILDKLVSE